MVPVDHLDAGHDSQLSQEHAQLLLLVHRIVRGGVDWQKHTQGGACSPARHHVQDAGNLTEEKIQGWRLTGYLTRHSSAGG